MRPLIRVTSKLGLPEGPASGMQNEWNGKQVRKDACLTQRGVVAVSEREGDGHGTERGTGVCSVTKVTNWGRAAPGCEEVS